GRHRVARAGGGRRGGGGSARRAEDGGEEGPGEEGPGEESAWGEGGAEEEGGRGPRPAAAAARPELLPGGHRSAGAAAAEDGRDQGGRQGAGWPPQVRAARLRGDRGQERAHLGGEDHRRAAEGAAVATAPCPGHR